MASSHTENNMRIAKNTMLLYARTIIVLVVSLYLSRLILQTLGVEDMGIYSVVGGIVTLISFIQNAQAKATSRFITFDLGKENNDAQRAKTFSICMTIHILIAICLFVFCETFGLWIINHWTTIPLERMPAAHIAYQFAVLSLMIQIVRIPYDSVVIAHENMSIYAIISLIDVFLKVGFVTIIGYLEQDHLILYSVALCVISFINIAIYFCYIKKHYPEYKYRWIFKKKESREVLSFSGWSLSSSATNAITQQGVNLLFNNFVGIVANAALGFANQISLAVNQLVSSFTTAFNPQIIKLYSSQEMSMMHTLISRASKYSFALAYLLGLPAILNMDFLLEIWLKDVPEYTVEFAQLLLVCCIIDATSGAFYTAIIATGNIKKYQICISLSFILDILCAYLILQAHINPPVVFIGRIITRGLINMIIGLKFSHTLIDFSIMDYLRTVILPIIATLVLTIPVTMLVGQYLDGWAKLISSSILSTSLILLSTYFVIMTSAERKAIQKPLSKKLPWLFKAKS